MRIYCAAQRYFGSFHPLRSVLRENLCLHCVAERDQRDFVHRQQQWILHHPGRSSEMGLFYLMESPANPLERVIH